MNTDEILETLEAHLRASQPLDAIFFSNPDATTAERAAYYHRQERAEALRHLFDTAARAAPQPGAQKPATTQLTVADPASGASNIASLCRLSHDIRNQLHVIVGSCEVLADHQLDSDAATLLEHIRNAAMKAAAIAKTTTCRIAELNQQASKKQ